MMSTFSLNQYFSKHRKEHIIYFSLKAREQGVKYVLLLYTCLNLTFLIKRSYEETQSGACMIHTSGVSLLTHVHVYTVCVSINMIGWSQSGS